MKSLQTKVQNCSKLQSSALSLSVFYVYSFCLVLFLMIMDGLQVIESLDSLWFFSNIICSSTTQPLASDIGDGNVTQNHAKESPLSEPFKPITPILENQQNQPPNAGIIMVQRCPKCGDFVAETEAQILDPVTVEMVESSKPPDKEERRKRRRRRTQKSIKDSFYQRGRILGELDLGDHDLKWGDGDVDFDVNNVFGSWMVEETCGYERFASQNHNVKMPPLNDGMAMKEHLKSWAYAVACTVR